MLEPTWAPLRFYGPRDVLDEQKVTARLREILEGWKGTRYGSGQRCRGVAADCLGFVCGALDDIDGRPRAQDPSIPPDAALHDPYRAREAIRDLLAVYEPWTAVEGSLQPFDIVVAGPHGGGPGHALLVGPDRNTTWSCSQGLGVHRGGWSLDPGCGSFHAAYRLADRWRWLR